MVSLLASGSAASAQESTGARSIAVQLFDRAESLSAEGRYSEACPKYAESYRLDPQLGVLLYLAECHEKSGLLASAWATFREAKELAEKRGDPRTGLAKERASLLEPRLARLTVVVPEASRVQGLVLRRDGVVIDPSAWEEPLALDPGQHRVDAEAPGRLPWSSTATLVDEGKVVAVTVPMLPRAPSLLAPAASSPSTALPRPPEARSELPPHAGSGQRVAAIAFASVGVLGLGASGLFGLAAKQSFDDSEPLCNAEGACTREGVELRDTAQSRALVATVAGSAGLLSLAAASVLWLTAPKSLESRSAGSTRAWSVSSDGRSLTASWAGGF